MGSGAEAETGLPEDSAILPSSAGTPVKLLGQPDGNIDSYNLEKSKCVNPFRCREFDECTEIEMSHSPNEEPTNPTTEYSKEDSSSTQGSRKHKMQTTSFATPILKENHKRDSSSMPQLDEGAMKCQVLESDAVGLDARVECGVVNPTELENNIRVYDVEVAAYGNYKGHGLHLAHLVSKSTRKAVKGYPVTVEALEDSCPAPNTEVHCPAISWFDCLMERKISVPRQARSLRKRSGRTKILEHDLVKSWGSRGCLVHNLHELYQNLVSPGCCEHQFKDNGEKEWCLDCNPTNHDGSLIERSNRKPEVTEGFQQKNHSASKPASSRRQTRSFPSFLKMIQVRI